MSTGCSRCGGNGYLTFAEGEYARARICDCMESCSVCRGEGFVHVENERGYVFAQKCVCQKLQNRVVRFSKANLPAMYHDKLLEYYQPGGGNQKEVRYHAFKFRKDFKPGDRGILYWGGPGVGKTHLMAAMMRYLTLEMGMSCRFIDFFHLVTDLFRQWKTGKSGAALIDPVINVPVLAIDELGKGRSSEWALDLLDEIISKRYNRRLTTFFTTNLVVPIKAELSPVPQMPARKNPISENLDERVGPRINSRIIEMCTVINIYGPDFRTHKTVGG